jgi:hypothetical protein
MYDYGLPDGIIANPYYGQAEPKAMYAYLSSCPEDKYLGAMCFLLSHRGKYETKRLATVEVHGDRKIEYYDYRFEFETLKRMVYAMSIKACEVHKLEEVEVTDGAIHNVV